MHISGSLESGRKSVLGCIINSGVTAGLYIGRQRSQTQGRDLRSQRIEDVEAAGAFAISHACEGSMIKKNWILTLRWLTHS